ncbi:MAG: alpha-glucan family phosphorylase [Gemmatimonadota bacterium]
MPDEPNLPHLPPRIQGLAELAMNLWWRTDRRALDLLRRVDPALWVVHRSNPVAILRSVDPEHLTELAADPAFVGSYDRVMEDFREATAQAGGWFKEQFPDLMTRPVAYFCAEFGLHNSLPIYSGGLGVLAGDHCKAASDLGVPFVGVGLLYSRGYFDQKVNLDGWQEDSEEVFHHELMPLVRLTGPDGSRSLTVLETSDRPVHIGAWKVDVGTVRLYLLDTDLEENHPEDRQLTYTLYGGGEEYRLKQEWILGVGGVRVLRALGVDPGAWHANEGHAAFMMVERLREELNAGTGWDEAVRRIRARSIFTTHTPVPAGHDTFSPDLVWSVCNGYHESLGIDQTTFMELGSNPGVRDGRFHMTAAAIRLAAHVNGVSKRHGAVSREIWSSMWPDRPVEQVPIGSVTNGVHLATWMTQSFLDLLDPVMGPDWERGLPREQDWDRVRNLPDARIWDTHRRLKKELLKFCQEQARQRWTTLWKESAHVVGAGTLLTSEPLTIGFARRFATYKRGALLFRDPERLVRLLTDLKRPVQLVFAGKAHPADDEGKRVLQQVWQATRDPRFQGRIAFLEDYDLLVAHRMVRGVDLWLNLPRVPKEASGTSGMKAALNGVPQLSTRDGWWEEGFTGENGWVLPLAEGGWEEVDDADYDAVFDLLENEIVPMFYRRDMDGVPREWVQRMKESIVVAGKRFTTGRMVRDYAERYYVPALRGELDHDDRPVFAEPTFLERVVAASDQSV